MRTRRIERKRPVLQGFARKRTVRRTGCHGPIYGVRRRENRVTVKYGFFEGWGEESSMKTRG